MILIHRAGLIIGCLAIWVLPGCQPRPAEVSLADSHQQEEEPTIIFEGFHMVSSRMNEVEWEMDARAAQIFERSNNARAQDVRITYRRDGRILSTLTARRGFIDTESNDMRAEDHVIMVSSEGITLRTERLQWDNQNDRMFTDLPVTVERSQDVLTGVGLEADSGLQKIRVLSQVKIAVKSVKELRDANPEP